MYVVRQFIHTGAGTIDDWSTHPRVHHVCSLFCDGWINTNKEEKN